MELITIYNYVQAYVFLKHHCTLVSIGLNEETRKIKFIFLKDQIFNDVMKKWQDRTL